MSMFRLNEFLVRSMYYGCMLLRGRVSEGKADTVFDDPLGDGVQGAQASCVVGCVSNDIWHVR